MRSRTAALVLVLMVGTAAPMIAQDSEFPTVEATHFRTDEFIRCAKARPEGPLFGAYKGQFVVPVAGVRLRSGDGPGLMYCLEVNNGYDDRHPVDASARGTITVPRWMRRHAKSAQVVVNASCSVRVLGYRGTRPLWRLEASGRAQDRGWNILDLPVRPANRTVTMRWDVQCL